MSGDLKAYSWQIRGEGGLSHKLSSPKQQQQQQQQQQSCKFLVCRKKM